MPFAPFVPLRVLSSYSMLEGAIDPKAIAKQARKLGFPAAGLTDRNGLYAAMAFSDACRDAGVQPIVGTLLAVARGNPGAPDQLQLLQILLVSGLSTIVFWVAHVYARATAGHAAGTAQSTRHAWREAVAHSWGLLIAPIPAVVVLLLGALGIVPGASSGALWLNVVVLAVLAALAKLAAAVAAELTAAGLRIIGVTGSSGKTSTKDLLAAVLAPLGQVVAPPGSFNNELGHPWTVLRATTDTDFLILEMSARHPGNIAALAAIATPSVGVVLNVGTAHLGEFGSREAIAATKSELPQSVPASGVVILNADDSAVAAMAAKTAARVVRVSRAPGADVWSADEHLDELARPRFTLHTADGAVDIALAVHGEHQVSNALAAAAVAVECGASLEQVATALAGAGPVSARRMDVSTRADGVTIVNDAYNANPDSMAAGLKALAWMARSGGQGGRRRSWAVLGEMAELGEDADEVLAEAELGSLFALVERAAAGGLTLTDITALLWHCLPSENRPERIAVGEAVLGMGLVGATVPVRSVLAQVLQGEA